MSGFDKRPNRLLKFFFKVPVWFHKMGFGGWDEESEREGWASPLYYFGRWRFHEINADFIVGNGWRS